MPLVKETLALELKGIFAEMKTGSMDENDYADKIAQAIDKYIKTATVTTTVTGTCSTGPVAGSGTGSLS